MWTPPRRDRRVALRAERQARLGHSSTFTRLQTRRRLGHSFKIGLLTDLRLVNGGQRALQPMLGPEAELRGKRRAMKFREHGPKDGAPTVVVLHGGPGAPGSAGGLARLLADPARVLEPRQEARTVATHISDVLSFVSMHCDAPPVVIGHSWGAMLALAFAAEHPSRVASLCLVCSGTFDLEARAEFKRALAVQMPKNAEAASRSAIEDRIYTIDPLPADPLDGGEFDERANETSWADMLRLQADGTYPAAFARIRVPVLMVHGADDPHPGRMIRASLASHLPQLEYRELARCSHYPWREREARDEFASLVRTWIAGH